MAEKEPSLEEVLRGVPPEKLDQPCQDKHLCEVTRHVTDWPYLAPFLGISTAEMEAIRGKWPFSIPGQKIEFLRKWQEKRGRKATYRRLCKAFIKLGEVALAEKVCDVLTGQGSSTSESSEDEGSNLAPPPTDKQQPGSSEVDGPHPPTGPVVYGSISLHHTDQPHPTGGDPLVTESESRGPEPSTMPYPRPLQPRTSKVATQASPTEKLAQEPHPTPHLPPPQPERVVSLPGSHHTPHPLPVPPGGHFAQDVSPPLCHTAPPPPSDVHPLDPYSTYLRDMYDIIQPQSLVLQWPPPPTKRVFDLAMTHSEGIQCGPVYGRQIRLLQIGNVYGYMEKRASIQPCNFFELDNAKRKIVLIEGAPGSGKSTLAWNACQRWKARELFQEFRMVVFVQLRDPRVQSAQSIADLLPAGSEERRRDAAEGIRACGGRGVLFVMDGWDEFGPGLMSDSIVSKLISKSDELEVPYSMLLITSRPIASAALQPLASSRLEIVGFTPQEVSQYFREAVKDPVAIQALQEQLKELPVIEASCYLPLNAAIVAHLFLGLNHTLPRTHHGVFSKLVCGCIIRHLTKQSGDIPEIRSLNKLPCEVQALFESVCLLAYKASMKNKATFSSEDLSSYGVSVEGSGLGLMQGVQSFLSGKSYSYHFLHLSVQELLAAVHVSKLGAGEQVSIFRELFSEPRLVAMFHFYAALTKLETEGIREIVASVLNRPSYEDFMFGRSEATRWRRHVLNILHCLYEAQDVSLCLYVASLLVEGLDLCWLSLSPLDCLCVGYFLRCVCVGREGEFGVELRGCGLDNYCVGFVVQELGKCVACSGDGGSSNAVVGCLGLNFEFNNINGSGVRLVCELMRSNPSVIRRLDLSANKMIQDGEDGLLGLLQVLCSIQWLAEMRLYDCDLRIDGENGPVLVEMLRKNVSLKELQLGGNHQIGGVGLSYIVEGMIENSGVVRLGLAACGIGEEGSKLLRRMLTENSTLEHLHIGSNGALGDAGIMEVGEGLKVNCRLEELKMFRCGYSLNGLKDFALRLRGNSHLRRLWVWDKEVKYCGGSGGSSRGESSSECFETSAWRDEA